MKWDRWAINMHNLERLHRQAERRKQKAEEQAAWRARKAEEEAKGNGQATRPGAGG